MNVKIISAILVLALAPLASMACGFSVDLPNQVKAGPEVTDKITVADPESDETRLSLSFGAGELKLSSGADGLIEGTALYNVKEMKPEVIKNGPNIEIKQGNFDGIPPFNNLKNQWDLKLGSAPMDLTIDAGAYEGTMELGGLSLKSLAVKDGAASVNLSFSEPNLIEMSALSYSTGASEVKLSGLGNANFSSFDFDGGAGSYTLDFSGELQRDAAVKIDTGLSDLTLIIPEGVDAKLTMDGGLTDINLGNGWTHSGNVYSHEGTGPTLDIVINMGAGNVTVKE
ncbi:MAG TPA: toast rack family protein [Anaerolineales bacterium]|nr:toast rack family protein [Anaerolineales bacterium]